MYTCIHTHTHTHIYIYKYIYIYIYIYIYVCVSDNGLYALPLEWTEVEYVNMPVEMI